MDILKQVRALVDELFNTTFHIEDEFGHTHTMSINNIGYSFKFDHAKRRFGCCNYRKQQITLSKHLCEVNPHQLNLKIKDTILHEMAHAFSFNIYGSAGRGHGRKWQSIAKQIGSDGKRCYSDADFGGIEMPESKYTLTCNTCGNTRNMHRRPKRRYSCGQCSDKFDPEYLMELVQNY